MPPEHQPDESIAWHKVLDSPNDLHTPANFRNLADKVRDRTGGIPVEFRIAASHVEADIDFALEASADYIILDGRGGGTGAAPTILRDHINVPPIPALARACGHHNLRDFSLGDLSTFSHDTYRFTSIAYAGMLPY